MGLAMLAVFFCFPAEAGLIIDTGQPSDTRQFLLDGQNYTGLGGRIYLDQPYDLSRLEGWLRQDTTDGPNICAARLYQDGIIEPNGYNPGQIIAQYLVAVTKTGVAGWYGVDLPSLRLAAGWYWLAFEIDGNYQDFSGVMLGDSPHPLSLEAKTWAGNDAPWLRDEYLNLGFRVYGELVPLPGAVVLLGSGLLGLAGWRRFRKD